MDTARASSVEADALARSRVAPAERVTERRRRPVDWGTLAVHALLLLSVAVIAFPLYYAFVISTQDVSEVIQKPPRLWPSTHMLDNYAEAWRRSWSSRVLDWTPPATRPPPGPTWPASAVYPRTPS